MALVLYSIRLNPFKFIKGILISVIAVNQWFIIKNILIALSNQMFQIQVDYH